MAVNLSPVGGAAAQFFTNTGAVLTGGKLYTYLAGTTTPATTYTTSAGNVARTNPIILDAAGRVSGGGEIWLTVGVTYKFLLKDSDDVLIGTYDNIPSTFNTDASLVTYTPAGANAVTTTVQAKLRQYVSVIDFGAVGDGVTNDTAAFANAIAFLDTTGGGAIFIPDGIYMLDSLTMTARSKILDGESMGSPTLTHGVILRCRAPCTDFITLSGVAHQINRMCIDGNGYATGAVVRYKGNMTDVVTSDVIITGGVSGGYTLALSSNPVNNNAQISELQFYGVLLNGGAGVTNLYINSDQAVVNSFYSLKSFSADYGIRLIRGTAALYCPFFVSNTINDIKTDRGQITIFDGRSESNPTNSLSFGGTTDFQLNSYVHGSTIAVTTLVVEAGWTGNGVVINGSYTNIIASNTGGNLVLINYKLYPGGLFYGAGKPLAFQIHENILSTNQINYQNGNSQAGTYTGIPISGTYDIGTILWNLSTSPGGYVGYVCTVSGTPGTWAPFGQAGVTTSIGSTPSFVGEVAVVAGSGYIAVGTASSADWKQTTP